jgi:small subunit ribosomal protein S30e
MGKVHGSLARNGKVRNQAPKVAKQERAKKRVTGRSKKRQQYNRRVLAVDPNDKRKKGPNFGAGRKPEDIPK